MQKRYQRMKNKEEDCKAEDFLPEKIKRHMAHLGMMKFSGTLIDFVLEHTYRYILSFHWTSGPKGKKRALKYFFDKVLPYCLCHSFINDSTVSLDDKSMFENIAEKYKSEALVFSDQDKQEINLLDHEALLMCFYFNLKQEDNFWTDEKTPASFLMHMASILAKWEDKAFRLLFFNQEKLDCSNGLQFHSTFSSKNLEGSVKDMFAKKM